MVSQLRLRKKGDLGPRMITICNLEGKCDYKKLKRNPGSEFFTCLFEGACNQKEVMSINEAVKRGKR